MHTQLNIHEMEYNAEEEIIFDELTEAILESEAEYQKLLSGEMTPADLLV